MTISFTPLNRNYFRSIETQLINFKIESNYSELELKKQSIIREIFNIIDKSLYPKDVNYQFDQFHLDYMIFLKNQGFKPNKIFEFGTCSGKTTFLMALNSPEKAKIYTIICKSRISSAV